MKFIFISIVCSFVSHLYQGTGFRGLRLAEMPTSGDLKSGDCLFSLPPPPAEFQRTPLPLKKKIDPAPNRNDLGHYMMSYMMYVLSKFEIIVLMLEIIFVND